LTSTGGVLRPSIVERGTTLRKQDVVKAWGRILRGFPPSLSIEITRECPLRCPGCYAYEPEHLGEAGPLRSLADYKGEALVEGVLALVRRYRPLHLSIVGGDPLMRRKELDILLPKLSAMGVSVQVVTSAVVELPAAWRDIPHLSLVVSIDGLRPEHDARRAPATYDRILKNIEGHSIIVHSTITGQTAGRPGYFREFLDFWSNRPEVRKIWYSLFTPQKGAQGEEILTPVVRGQVLDELSRLRKDFPKLELPDLMIRGFEKPPQSPDDCIFARTTLNITADLKTRIAPCQFGGDPDCSQCGCVASAGLAGVGEYRLFGMMPLRSIFKLSNRVGDVLRPRE
jgi:sulfatase maturation enzyme AslB (radical SAM superfamily)